MKISFSDCLRVFLYTHANEIHELKKNVRKVEYSSEVRWRIFDVMEVDIDVGVV